MHMEDRLKRSSRLNNWGSYWRRGTTTGSWRWGSWKRRGRVGAWTTRILGLEGGQPKGIRDVLQGGSAGGVAFWVGYVGTDPPQGTCHGQFSIQSSVSYHKEAAKEAGGGGMGLSTAGNSCGGGNIWGDLGLHPKEVEHFHAIYCYVTDSGPLWSNQCGGWEPGFLRGGGNRRGPN